MYTYIEIRKYGSDVPDKRYDVTKESQHNRDKIERGMNINLNHEKYYTAEVESAVELPIIR